MSETGEPKLIDSTREGQARARFEAVKLRESGASQGEREAGTEAVKLRSSGAKSTAEMSYSMRPDLQWHK